GLSASPLPFGVAALDPQPAPVSAIAPRQAAAAMALIRATPAPDLAAFVPLVPFVRLIPLAIDLASALQRAAASIGLSAGAPATRVFRACAFARSAQEVLVARAVRATAAHGRAGVGDAPAGAPERGRRARGRSAAHVRVRDRVARLARGAAALQRAAAAVVVRAARVAAWLSGAAGDVAAGIGRAGGVVAVAGPGRPGRARRAHLPGRAPARDRAARAIVEADAALAGVGCAGAGERRLAGARAVGRGAHVPVAQADAAAAARRRGVAARAVRALRARRALVAVVRRAHGTTRVLNRAAGARREIARVGARAARPDDAVGWREPGGSRRVGDALRACGASRVDAAAAAVGELRPALPVAGIERRRMRNATGAHDAGGRDRPRAPVGRARTGGTDARLRALTAPIGRADAAMAGVVDCADLRGAAGVRRLVADAVRAGAARHRGAAAVVERAALVLCEVGA